MSARYWVLVADELLQDMELPEGLRIVEPDERDTYLEGDDADAPPGCGLWLFEDDGAPATLDGKRVELTFVRSGDGVMIGSRRPHV